MFKSLGIGTLIAHGLSSNCKIALIEPLKLEFRSVLAL
jgi:hypothetical protein